MKEIKSHIPAFRGSKPNSTTVCAYCPRCDSEEFDEAIEVIAWMPLPEPYKESEVKD